MEYLVSGVVSDLRLGLFEREREGEGEGEGEGKGKKGVRGEIWRAMVPGEGVGGGGGRGGVEVLVQVLEVLETVVGCCGLPEEEIEVCCCCCCCFPVVDFGFSSCFLLLTLFSPRWLLNCSSFFSLPPPPSYKSKP